MLQRQLIAINHIHDLVNESRRMAAAAMARAEGLARLLLPTAPAIADVPKSLEKQAEASLAADKAFEDATEIRIGEHGQLLPLDPDAVLAATARVHDTTAAFFDASRAVEEPHIDEALDNIWRFHMFSCYVTHEQEAAESLRPNKLLMLQEMLRSAEMHICEERHEHAFGMLAKWIELYARDAVIKASQKCPENMLVRLQYYVIAPYPADPWTPSKAVQAWRQIGGRPVSPPDVKPGGDARG